MHMISATLAEAQMLWFPSQVLGSRYRVEVCDRSLGHQQTYRWRPCILELRKPTYVRKRWTSIKLAQHCFGLRERNADKRKQAVDKCIRTSLLNHANNQRIVAGPHLWLNPLRLLIQLTFDVLVLALFVVHKNDTSMFELGRFLLNQKQEANW